MTGQWPSSRKPSAMYCAFSRSSSMMRQFHITVAGSSGSCLCSGDLRVPETGRVSAGSRVCRARRSAPQAHQGLVLALGDFEQVIAELCLHRALHHADRRAEDHFVEFAHHFAAAKVAQITALAAGRAARVFLGDLSEVGTVFNGL